MLETGAPGVLVGRRRGSLPQTPRVWRSWGWSSCHVSDPSRSDVTRSHSAELPSVVSVVGPGPRSVSLPGLRCPDEVTFPGLWIRLPIIALQTGRCKINISGAWSTRSSGGGPPRRPGGSPVGRPARRFRCVLARPGDLPMGHAHREEPQHGCGT